MLKIKAEYIKAKNLQTVSITEAKFIDYFTENLSLKQLNDEIFQYVEENNICKTRFKLLKSELQNATIDVTNSYNILQLMLKGYVIHDEKPKLLIRSIEFLEDITTMLNYFCEPLFSRNIMSLLIMMIDNYNIIYIKKIINHYGGIENLLSICKGIREKHSNINLEKNSEKNSQSPKATEINSQSPKATEGRKHDNLVNNDVTISNLINYLLLKVNNKKIIDYIHTNNLIDNTNENYMFNNFGYLMYKNIKFSAEVYEKIYSFNNRKLINVINRLVVLKQDE